MNDGGPGERVIGVLRMTLQVAVPLWIAEVRHRTPEDLAIRASECGQIVAEKGDALQFGGKKGEAALAFNALAEGLACGAFCPGGIEFLGDRWEVDVTGKPITSRLPPRKVLPPPRKVQPPPRG